MLVSLAERSLSTHMVDGVPTVVALSLEKISPRSIDLLHTLPAGLPSHWSMPSSLVAHLSNFPTPLGLQNHSPYSLIATVLPR